eukprot:c29318_g3_i2 orf=13-1434(+)
MEMERLRGRGVSLIRALASLPPLKLAPSCHARLAKLLHSELRFLNQLSDGNQFSKLCSTNLGYLDAVVCVLQHPLVDAVSAVLQTVPVKVWRGSLCDIEMGAAAAVEAQVHVDIVCTFNGRPVWFVVSDRNPKYLNWVDGVDGSKGLRSRVLLLLRAAIGNVVLRPSAVIFCFAKGVPETLGEKLHAEFGAARVESFGRNLANRIMGGSTVIFQDVEEGEWVDILIDKDHLDWYSSEGTECTKGGQVRNLDNLNRIHGWATFQVDVKSFLFKLKNQSVTEPELSVNEDFDSLSECLAKWNDSFFQIFDQEDENLATLFRTLHSGFGNQLEKGLISCYDQPHNSFSSLLEALRIDKGELSETNAHQSSQSNFVNLDTTAMIAIVSEASNGVAGMLMSMPEEELRQKFGSTAKFMRDQAESELEKPLLLEMLAELAHKRPFISQYVHDEFKSVLAVCGGDAEKQRADGFLRLLLN